MSVLHPFQALPGWHAPFEDEMGQRRFVREYRTATVTTSTPSALAASRCRHCREVSLTARRSRRSGAPSATFPRPTLAAYVGLPAALIWRRERRDA